MKELFLRRCRAQAGAKSLMTAGKGRIRVQGAKNNEPGPKLGTMAYCADQGLYLNQHVSGNVGVEEKSYFKS